MAPRLVVTVDSFPRAPSANRSFFALREPRLVRVSVWLARLQVTIEFSAPVTLVSPMASPRENARALVLRGRSIERRDTSTRAAPPSPVLSPEQPAAASSIPRISFPPPMHPAPAALAPSEPTSSQLLAMMADMRARLDEERRTSQLKPQQQKKRALQLKPRQQKKCV